MSRKIRGEKADGPASAAGGGFDPDGSWKSWHSIPSAVDRYVALLVRARLASRISPAELAEQMRGSAYREAFPSANLREWDGLADWGDWHRATTRSSAEEAVKRCGRGYNGHWEGGTWVHGQSPERSEAADPALVLALVASAGVPPEDQAPPLEGARAPLPDEEFFKGWAPLPPPRMHE